MRLVKISDLSEEERKKALEEQRKRLEANRQASEQLRQNANNQFNELVKKEGAKQPGSRATIREIKNAYKGSSNYDTVKKSLNEYYKNNKPNMWESITNMAKSWNSKSNKKNQMDFKKNGQINESTIALSIAQKNTENANKVKKMTESAESYKKAQEESIKNTINYKILKRQNPKATDEELLKKYKEEQEKSYNATIQNIAEAKTPFERAKLIKQNSLGSEEYAKQLRNEAIQQQGKNEAEEINKTLQNGTLSEKIGVVIKTLGKSAGTEAINMTASPFLELGSLTSSKNSKNHTQGYGYRDFDEIIDDFQSTIIAPERVKQANLDSEALKTGARVSGTIGGMVPSILTSLMAPGTKLPMAVQALGVSGTSYAENLNEDKSNKGKSALTGLLKGGTSYITEKITGGNILGKGSLDDFATKTIASKTSNKLAQKVASKVYEIGGENVEEFLENNIGYVVDAVVNDKGITMREWLEEQGQTAKDTTLSTLALNLLGLGGSTYKDVKEYSKNAEMNKWIDEAKTIIKKENINIDTVFPKEILQGYDNIQKNTSKSQTEKVLENSNNIGQSTPQNETQAQIDKTLESINNIGQNKQNSNESVINNTTSNYNQEAISEINNSYLTKKEKKEMLNTIENIELDKTALDEIKTIIQENSRLQDNVSYKTDNNRKQTYGKYRNSKVEYDQSQLDIALDSVKTNRNGKRTASQWLEVAKILGRQIADKNNAEIEKIAFRSWNDLQPNTKDSITRYDNRTKTNVPFKKFTSDEWVNAIYKEVNKTRKEVKVENKNDVPINNIVNNKVANNSQTLYNDIALGDIKNVPIQDILALKTDGGYRDTKQMESLRKDIREKGIKNPIELVRNSDGTIKIENGNHRLQIANELGLKEVPVKFVESWDNIGRNIVSSESKIIKRMEDYNDRNNSNSREANITNGRSGAIKRNSFDNRNKFEDGRRATRNDKLPRGIQKYNDRPSGTTTFKQDIKQKKGIIKNIVPTQEVSKETSISLPTREDIANDSQTLYNNTEREGGISGEQRRNTSRIQTSTLGSEKENAFSIDRYKQEETRIRNQGEVKYTDNDKNFATKMKNKYNKKIFVFDDTNTSYSGGLSYIDNDTIMFGRNALDDYGYDFLEGHEILEDINKNHKDTAEKTLNNLKQKVQDDAGFGDVFLKYIADMNDNVYQYYINKPELVAKEIIGDLNGLRNANIDYSTLENYKALDSQLVKEIQDEVLNLEDIIYNKEKQDSNKSSFSIQQVNLPTREDVANNKTKNNPLMTNDISEHIKAPLSQKAIEEKTAEILAVAPEKQKESNRIWAIAKANILDKGIVFEKLSQKAKNRKLQAKWDYTLTATARGQNAIGNPRYEFTQDGKKQKQISKSLEEIRQEVGEKQAEFSKYMYHQLNIDRMTLEERFGGDTGINYERINTVKNKPVFGESVTAEVSRKIVEEYEAKYPEFKKYAQDVYDYNKANMKELVDNGVVSQELADILNERYPHYVPITRVNKEGNAVKIPLDTNRTGINTPLAKAKGGSSDILPLFDTLAKRTLQTYRASARNSFGVELKNTLNTINKVEQSDIDNIIEDIGNQENNQELLQEGKNGNNPTFTVFDNGKKVTYEITKDMYDALKPISESSLLNKTIKPFNKMSNFRRGVLTEYNPVFMLTNSIKDFQDMIINSQHATKTVFKMPEAYAQILSKGYWYKEYIQNGGKQNSYFDANDNVFESDVLPSKGKRAITLPLRGISAVNNIIETAPRLAEYIASREAGRDIETSMLDSARVTTNFKAGGDFTKALNRNGFTFLNASVQGAMQQVRNIKEANVKGLKGWTVLACKYAIAGAPAILLNNLLWDDDEDYNELQDYVKDSYYCIAKYGDGQFLRIPKGRTTAVIQKIVGNIDKYLTDDKEINIDNLSKDFWEDIKFTMDNLAPNNPFDNFIFAPIMQTAKNKSWYGEDIVPSRLQDKPKEEQFDETTDKFSKWLGEKIKQSPYKINYLLDQYGGGISDVLLPLMTPQAENNVLEDKFTTDSIMKSRYPGEFFEKADEIKVKSNSSKATDKDTIKDKYMTSISEEVNKLYKEKREIQNSNKTDKEKKEKLKEVQKKINKISKDATLEVDKVIVKKYSSKVGEEQYIKNSEGKWKSVTDKDKEKNKKANLSLEVYSEYKHKIDVEKNKKVKNGELEENQDLKKDDKIQVIIDSKYNVTNKTKLYENYIKSEEDYEYDIMKTTNMTLTQFNEYLKYKQQDFESDKEDDGTLKGKTITNSKKNKVYNYMNNMDITGTQRLLLVGMKYKLNSNEREKIYQYVNDIKGIDRDTHLEMFSKFKGFKVYKDGTIKY